MKNKPNIKIHNAEDFEGMRKAGRLGAKTLDFIAPFVKMGVTTEELNTRCHDFIIAHNAIPAPLNYRGFPKSICTSINEVVCHGIPGTRQLVDGDIFNIDVTVILDGWHGDTSRMFFIGDISAEALRLIEVTHEAMWCGLRVIRPGLKTGIIGYAIQKYVEAHGFSVVRDFCGHGLGRVFHDTPQILHFGRPDSGEIMEEGMFFTIEPMVNAGDYPVRVLDDGWTMVTKDFSLSAQYEHSVGVTFDGYEVFTEPLLRIQD